MRYLKFGTDMQFIHKKQMYLFSIKGSVFPEAEIWYCLVCVHSGELGSTPLDGSQYSV